MERIKHDRDAKCGGVDESGRYRALHRRREEQKRYLYIVFIVLSLTE